MLFNSQTFARHCRKTETVWPQRMWNCLNGQMVHHFHRLQHNWVYCYFSSNQAQKQCFEMLKQTTINESCRFAISKELHMTVICDKASGLLVIWLKNKNDFYNFNSSRKWSDLKSFTKWWFWCQINFQSMTLIWNHFKKDFTQHWIASLIT